jgi:hypothetical protein
MFVTYMVEQIRLCRAKPPALPWRAAQAAMSVTSVLSIVQLCLAFDRLHSKSIIVVLIYSEYADKPSIVRDFHSLLLSIQTMIGFALTDDARPLQLCKHCSMVFAAGYPNTVMQPTLQKSI